MANKHVDEFGSFKNLFENIKDNEFYYVFVINREKDENEDEMKIENYDSSLPWVFDFAIFRSGWCITSYEELIEKESEIKALCEEKHARAYITINPRTYSEVKEIAEKIRTKWNRGDFSFMYAATFGEFFNYYEEGWVMTDEYAEWLNKHPRVLVDVDIDSENGLKDVYNLLIDNNINIIATAETTHGGVQFVTETDEVKNLDFSEFDVYERVGREYCGPNDPYCEPAVHCLDDIAINLYSNLV